uniref:Uncharacterized protein n=1 Tax=Ditylenchus dipsaci TaxID=166011 RepID=A0A915DWC3_9BILA
MLWKSTLQSSIRCAVFVNEHQFYLVVSANHIFKGTIKRNGAEVILESYDYLPPFCKEPIIDIGHNKDNLLVICGNCILSYTLNGFRECEMYLRDLPANSAQLWQKKQFDTGYRAEINYPPVVPYLTWSNYSLFSLTKNGNISKWRLLPNGRKLRESVHKLGIDNCQQIIGLGANLSSYKKNTISIIQF